MEHSAATESASRGGLTNRVDPPSGSRAVTDMAAGELQVVRARAVCPHRGALSWPVPLVGPGHQATRAPSWVRQRERTTSSHSKAATRESARAMSWQPGRSRSRRRSRLAATLIEREAIETAARICLADQSLGRASVPEGHVYSIDSRSAPRWSAIDLPTMRRLQASRTSG
jgi:hypothetical protein